MRAGEDLASRLMGRLFHEYLSTGEVYVKNNARGSVVGPIRALPHEEAVADGVEILDYERASCCRSDRLWQARRLACRAPIGQRPSLEHSWRLLVSRIFY